MSSHVAPALERFRRIMAGDSKGLHILLAASEVVGFAKTGGLADVAGALPVALAERGHSVSVILPLHRSARRASPAPVPTELVISVPVGDKVVESRLWRSSIRGDIAVWLVEQDAYFDRDDPALKRGLYQYTGADGSKIDYEDNCERWVFFNRAVLEAIPKIGLAPDVLHVNDWQTALIPVYLRTLYSRRRDADFGRTRCLLTIHNMAFQGLFWHLDMPLTGLPWEMFTPDAVEYYGKLSMLKGGIVYADRINTVSPTYAREIQTSAYGCGLEGLLAGSRSKLSGIVNGVDYTQWDPRVDPHLPANYGPDDLAGKAACKAALQKEYRLREDPSVPVLGVVARLTDQKGVDLIAAVAPGLLDQGAQLVILGEGDPKYHRVFEELRSAYPDRLGLLLGFSEPLAHRVEAGSDMFLMPSAYEPSGLNQLYSLRYGTPPIVRATGGLADTVTDTTTDTVRLGTATGFRFGPSQAHALWETTQRATALWKTAPDTWRKIVLAGMRQDWSWGRSAAEYEALYRRMLAS